MQPICTHKIGFHSSKPSHAYPIIRLPREFRELAGSRAEIYKTTHDGKLAFLVTIDQKVGNCCTTLDERETKSRLAALESELKDLKQLILQSENCAADNIKNQKAEGEIRTRVVASTGP